jgi:NAD(P)H-hydrate epimerase
MLTLTAAQSRALDRFAIDTLGIPGVVLMENAGRNVAHLLLSLGVRGPVVVCCGKGNNGGDGFVVARHLDVAGVQTRTVLFADPATLTGDAAVNSAILTKCGLSVETMPALDEPRLAQMLASADWIVDALFGSGLKGEIRSPFDRIIAAINAANKRVLAVDVPSGLDADTGHPLGVAVRATHTATVAANKAGFVHAHARPYVGEVHVIDVGVPPRLLSSLT